MVAPNGIEPEHVVTITASFEEETKNHYTEVRIIPDDVTLKVHEKK